MAKMATRGSTSPRVKECRITSPAPFWLRVFCCCVLPRTMADSQQAIVFRSKVRAGDLVAVRKMLQAGVDFTLPGTTLREWTPLHTAAWGTAKPQNDREIVEALLTAAHKSGKGKEEALRSAKDAKDGSAQHAEDAPLVSARAHRPCASCAWHGWLGGHSALWRSSRAARRESPRHWRQPRPTLRMLRRSTTRLDAAGPCKGASRRVGWWWWRGG